MISTVLNVLWIAFQLIIGYNLILPVVLLVVYFCKKTPIRPIEAKTEADYAIIVTAYEQTDSLPAVVKSILNLSYSNYLVYIVADKCDISGLKFDDERVIVLRPEETIASNTGSHFYAINRFRRNHERLTIIDSDNILHPAYLDELNPSFAAGYCAVQGLRAAKNLDTTYACLDAARDIYYHFYDGKILFNIGSSATLSGSGMAFTTQLYRDCLEHKNVSGAGFDKVLQYAILEKGERIAFAENAVVYDEKTTMPDQLVKQRSRWINTWFKYFALGFGLLGKSIKNLSFNQFVFGLILLRPPLFIFLILSVICMFVNIWISPVTAIFWLAGLLIFVLGFSLSLFAGHTDKRIYKSLINIPKFVFLQILSLAKSRKANKYSVATQHFHADKPANDQV